MQKEITCFFTGHREIPEDIYSDLYQKVCNNIKALYQRGYREFIAGGAIGFDTLCAEAVLEMRKTCDIRLSIYIPCRGQEKYFSDIQKEQYQKILDNADRVFILSEHYYRGCMHTRNRKMADDSSVCIAYCTKTTGGSAYTVDYAQKKGLEIIKV